MQKKMLALLAGVGLISAGCGSASAGASTQAKTTTITFDAMEYSSASLKQFPTFVKEFEAKNPDIHVDVRVINWSLGHQVINTEIGGGNPPDVAIIGTRWLPAYAQENLLQPLTKYMTPQYAGEFYSGALDSIQYKGIQYSLPEAMSVRLLIYNKKLFREAGIASPPTTWTQLAQDAIAIHNKTGESGYGLVGSQVETSLDYWYPMWGFGGHIVSGNKGMLTSSADVNALKFLVNLIHNHGTEPSVTASTRAGLETEFSAGKIGMMIDGPWLPAEALAAHEDIGITSVPAQSGVTPRNVAITDSMVMFKNANEAASWKFMQFMFTKGVRTQFDLTEGMLPTMKMVGAESQFKNSPVFSPYLKALAGNTRHEPVIRHFDEVSLDVTNAVQGAYSGAVSPAAALQQANQKIDQALQNQ